MWSEDELDEMIIRWEELIEIGQQPSIEEFCNRDADLITQFRKALAELQIMDRLMEGPAQEDATKELQTAGRYQPVALHAQGGLGDVYRAQDSELERVVALKRIRTLDSFNPTRTRRFEIEAKITGRLEHPGIVPIYGFERDSVGRSFYAMRMVQGTTLHEAIAEHHRKFPNGTLSTEASISLKRLLRVFLKVCETIGYAHHRDVIHRDIKPLNIMVGEYGEALVVDWGLAKIITNDHEQETSSIGSSGLSYRPFEYDQTMAGDIKGSPGYMSPEQASGQLERAGPLSDVYGLGATLFAILTNDKPVAGSNVSEVLEAVRHGRIQSPRAIRSDVDPSLAAICLKALSHDPMQRYASPADLGHDVENWLDDEPVSASPDPWLKRMARFVKRHRTLTMSAVTAVIISFLALGAFNIVLDSKNRELVAANGRAVENFEQSRATLLQIVELALHGRTTASQVELAPVQLEIMQRVVERAAALTRVEPENRKFQFENALFLTAKGELELTLEDFNAAAKTLEQAARIVASFPAPLDRDARHLQIVIQYRQAEMAAWQGRPVDEVHSLFTRLIKPLTLLIEEAGEETQVTRFNRHSDPAVMLAHCLGYTEVAPSEQLASIAIADKGLAMESTTDARLNYLRIKTSAQMWALLAQKRFAQTDNVNLVLDACQRSLRDFDRCMQHSEVDPIEIHALQWDHANVGAMAAQIKAVNGELNEAEQELRVVCDTFSTKLPILEKVANNRRSMWAMLEPQNALNASDAVIIFRKLQYVQARLSLATVVYMKTDAAKAQAEFAAVETMLNTIPAEIPLYARIAKAKALSDLATHFRQTNDRSPQAIRKMAQESAETLEQNIDTVVINNDYRYRLAQALMTVALIATDEGDHTHATDCFQRIEKLRPWLNLHQSPAPHRFMIVWASILNARNAIETETGSPNVTWESAKRGFDELVQISKEKHPSVEVAPENLKFAAQTLGLAALAYSQNTPSGQKKTPTEIREICQPAIDVMEQLSSLGVSLDPLDQQLLQLLRNQTPP